MPPVKGKAGLQPSESPDEDLGPSAGTAWQRAPWAFPALSGKLFGFRKGTFSLREVNFHQILRRPRHSTRAKLNLAVGVSS